MAKNNPNENRNRGRGDEAAIDPGMLFEATEAVIRAISAQDGASPGSADGAGGADEVIARALRCDSLAPFDGPVVLQAVDFLRRLGYLPGRSAA